MKVEIVKNPRLDLVSANVLVIDPCYVITHTDPVLDELWNEFCGKLYDDDQNPVHEFGHATVATDDGREGKFFFLNTAYGDGTYMAVSAGNTGHFGVDAGMYCIISVEDAKRLNPNLELDEGVEFKGLTGTVFIEHERNGKVKGNLIGAIEVVTDGSDREEDDD